MAHYESKFSIGDTVWAVRSQWSHRIVKCLTCANTGKVKIGAEEFICPKCNGRAAHPQFAGHKYYVDESGIVGQVRIEHTDHEKFYTHRSEEPNPKFEYMIDATGVGSGTIWKEADLFATREEAQRFCDAQNAPLLQDEAEMLPKVQGL